MNNENFRIISRGGKRLYWVSDRGRVISGCINREMKQTPNSAGYLGINIGTVHSLVMEAFGGPRPQGMEINHKDGNKLNNSLSNLEYCTHAYNIEHAITTGLFDVRGELNASALLTEDTVKAIRAERAAGARNSKLAVRYGVHKNTISDIVNRVNWRHVA